MADNLTKIENLIDPEVLADYVDSKLIDNIVFSPLAVVNRDLVGRPGDTLSIPVYAYIGDATDVAEGEEIPMAQLTASTTQVPVKKAGRGVQITDEAVLSGYGNPIDEAGKQLVTAISSKVETDIAAELKKITGGMKYTAPGKLDSKAIVNALVKFGEDLEGEKVLFVSPQQHADLINDAAWIPATDMGVAVLMKGVVGMIAGCQVVISNRIKNSGSAYDNYIVKPGAIGILLKRDTEAEKDRNIRRKFTEVTIDKHYGVYLNDASKAIHIVTNEAAAAAKM